MSGAVAAADAPSVPFSGWLELLRLLEDGVDPRPGGEIVPGPLDVQEAT